MVNTRLRASATQAYQSCSAAGTFEEGVARRVSSARCSDASSAPGDAAPLPEAESERHVARSSQRRPKGKANCVRCDAPDLLTAEPRFVIDVERQLGMRSQCSGGLCKAT